MDTESGTCDGRWPSRRGLGPRVTQPAGRRRARARRRGAWARAGTRARARSTPKSWRCGRRRSRGRGATVVRAPSSRAIHQAARLRARDALDRRGCRRVWSWPSRPEPVGRRDAGSAALREAGIEVRRRAARDARPRRHNAAFTAHVTTGPPVRRPEDGGVARRQGGGPRRLVEVDHRRDQARADVHRLRALVGRDRGGLRHRARRRSLRSRCATPRYAAARPPLRVMVDAPGRGAADARRASTTARRPWWRPPSYASEPSSARDGRTPARTSRSSTETRRAACRCRRLVARARQAGHPGCARRGRPDARVERDPRRRRRSSRALPRARAGRRARRARVLAGSGFAPIAATRAALELDRSSGSATT